MAVGIGGFVATGVWVVASVRTTTAVLGEQIAGLGREVERLREAIESNDTRHRELERRVDVVEASQPVVERRVESLESRMTASGG